MNLTEIVKQLWNDNGSAIAAGKDVQGVFRHLCRQCYDSMHLSLWREIYHLAPPEDDEKVFKIWLSDLLNDFAPGDNIKMLWFGLAEDFEIDEDSDDVIDAAEPGEIDEWLGNHDADVDDDDDEDEYQPAGAFVFLCGDRYMFSERRPPERQGGFSYEPPGPQFYPQIVESYYRKFHSENDDADLIATQFLIPGYVGLLAAAACREINPALLLGRRASRRVVFGWDEGVLMTLGEASRDGWQSRFTPIRYRSRGK